MPAHSPPTHDAIMKRSRSSRMLYITLAVLFICSSWPALVNGAEPLHVRINNLLQAKRIGPALSNCSDAEFLRRLYLDLTGRIPTSAEARAFLDDTSPDKRARLADQLLSSPGYAEHMATVFDVMLMERRPDKHVKADEWREFLLASFRENKSYSTLASEMLGADGVDAARRAAAKFTMDRDLTVDLLTRDVGRVFFGMDLECAQCHDHPLVNDYFQADYYGIYAFFNRSYIFQPDKKQPAVIAEKAEGDVKFKSVFTGDEGDTRPRLPGDQQIEEPTFKKGEEYKVKPDPKKNTVRPVPNYSRREVLAKLVQEGKNDAFRKNIVNRLWAHMIGRGLVHPVDFHHGANPASHSELLDELANEFAASGFDIRSFLREIALSNAYQRSFRMPNDVAPFVAEATKLRPGLSQQLEQTSATLPQLEQKLTELNTTLAKSQEAVNQKAAEKKKADEAATTARTAFDKAKDLLEQEQHNLSTNQAVAQLIAQAASQAEASAKLLPADKELGAVVADLRARLNQIVANVATLQKAVTDATAKQQTADSQLVAMQAAAAEAEKQLAVARESVAVTSQERNSFEKQKKETSHTVVAAQTRLAEIDLLLANDAASQKHNAAQIALASSNDQLAAAKKLSDDAKQQLAARQQAMAAAQNDLQQKTAALAQITTEMSTKQEAKPLLDNAFASARDAAKILADEELAAVTQQLESRSSQLQSEVAQLQQSVEAMQVAVADINKHAQAALAAQQLATKNAEAAAQQTLVAEKALAAARTEFDSRLAAFESSHAELTEAWTRSGDVAVLEPLSPEQLASSIMQISGLIDRTRAAEAVALDKKTPLSDEDKKDAAKVAERQRQIEKATYAKLKPTIAKFVTLFGAGAGQPQNDFFSTVDQALFFANGGEVQGWLRPSGDNLTDRLIKIEDAKQLAEELYLSVLTRRPSEQETADVADYLKSSGTNKAAAVQEMAWALVTSAEFRFQR